ncbi:N-formylglutamate amidohydrolase [Marinoscillum sp. MHG1-6]|uniref:N-formylglutamate amidohydrolase n=1 Tax=Marinoscillum sp. MHG1-6 TaxID=2959627 RepID=UPI0021586257|nr:N-formylglutamate amidohydrolase [Marinoscillum sp. MHG1-6]
MKRRSLIITCEHAGNYVPERFEPYFETAEKELSSHRGWDIGALLVAEKMSDYFGVECHHYDYSRLLIEVNRSIGHPQLFSEFTGHLPPEIKTVLVEEYYNVYRERVRNQIDSLVDERHSVVHISVHSFTPVWEGKEREVDIGLLYDEVRIEETAFCKKWGNAILTQSPAFNIRMNEPYNGADDGFTTTLRTIWPEESYLGIELEINQKHLSGNNQLLIKLICTGLKSAIESWK